MTSHRHEAERLAGEALPCKWKHDAPSFETGDVVHSEMCPAHHIPAIADLLEPLLVGREWKGMDSAPRDGTWFLACATEAGWGATRIVRFAYPDDRLPIHGEGNLWPSPPTHWRSLPAPPAKENE